MKIFALCVGMVQANCLVCWDEQTGLAFVTDPGGEPERILAFLGEQKLTVTHILCTHGHFDHVMALDEVKRATGAKVYVHRADAPKLLSADESLYSRFTGSREGFVPVCADVLLEEGDCLQAAGVTLRVLHTPGHTAGSICFDTGEVLLSGDTVFAGSCGRVDFPDGDAGQMMASLRRIAALEGERRVYSGHAESALLSEIRRFNPYVRQAVARG